MIVVRRLVWLEKIFCKNMCESGLVYMVQYVFMQYVLHFFVFVYIQLPLFCVCVCKKQPTENHGLGKYLHEIYSCAESFWMRKWCGLFQSQPPWCDCAFHSADQKISHILLLPDENLYFLLLCVAMYRMLKNTVSQVEPKLQTLLASFYEMSNVLQVETTDVSNQCMI